MKKTLFITGFPGFLASSLLQQLYDDHEEKLEHIYLLVLLSEEKAAYAKIQQMEKSKYINSNKCSIIVGDITKVNIGLNPDLQSKLDSKVTHVFHLAAVYDLAVPKKVAERVNVQGTTMVNKWVQTLPKLERYVYFSTAYVSGNREGKIYEHELNMQQTFRNHYEHTKYIAELLVDELKTTIPTTIIRPGVVKGHGETGETIKFDGLYFMLNMYERLRYLPVIPYIEEDGASPEGNFVPSDYVLEATSYLSMNDIGEGKTYHLTDPNPYTMRELQSLLAYYYLGRKPKGILPVSFIRNMLYISPIRKWLHVETEVLDYFTVHSSYDTTQAQHDLEGTGITCTDLENTLPSMIKFYRKYIDDHQKKIKIH